MNACSLMRTSVTEPRVRILRNFARWQIIPKRASIITKKGLKVSRKMTNKEIVKYARWLIKLGYQMSDEEKMFKDGTHVLYTKDEEETGE